MTQNNKLIHNGSLISLYKERVDLDSGKHTYFDIVKHPGGSVIAAINEHDEICILRQWRHAVKQFVWEFPAGCIEPNEAPLSVAKRELEEETGTIADDWQELGPVLASPGYSNEVLYFFVAKNLSQGSIKLDDAEQLDSFWLSLEKVYAMAKSGKISDAKTLAMIGKLLVSDIKI